MPSAERLALLARANVAEEWHEVDRHNLAVEIIEELSKAVNG